MPEEEITIRCPRMTPLVRAVKDAAERIQSESAKLPLLKGAEEFYLAPDGILFFETSGDSVFAHTEGEAYRTKLRLYELERMLPEYFARISKSAIINTRSVLSVDRVLASASLVRFAGSHKQVYVSRRYAKELRLRLRP